MAPSVPLKYATQIEGGPAEKRSYTPKALQVSKCRYVYFVCILCIKQTKISTSYVDTYIYHHAFVS